jgi:hypothetical protein
MRLVVLGVTVAMMVTGAGSALAQTGGTGGTGGSDRPRVAYQFEGDIADLASGQSQHLIVPVLVQGQQYNVVFGYLYKDGQPRSFAEPRRRDASEIPEGTAEYRAVMEAFNALVATAQAHMAAKAGASGTGGPGGGTSGTGGQAPFGLPGTTGTSETSGGTGDGPGASTGGTTGSGMVLSRHPHEVTRNPDGTVTVRVTMPMNQMRMLDMELRNIAGKTAAREVSPGRWVSNAQVQMVLTGATGSERNDDGTVTRWRTFRVTPQ